MVNKAPFSFQEQLKQGRKGEALFMEAWPLPLRRNTDIKGWDFIDSSGATIELKSDSYSMDKTPNCFIERWSDMDKESPGGPWQAHLKGATIFVYMYVKDRRALVFRDIPELLSRLKGLIRTADAVRVPNRGYTTLGYKVSRFDLGGLYEELDFSGKGAKK